MARVATKGIRFDQAPGAEKILAEVAAPGLEDAAQLLADRIPENVPVHEGTARRMTRTSSTLDSSGGMPQGRTWIESPFWHFLEYGTQFNPPYRPIQRAAEQAGMEYRPR